MTFCRWRIQPSPQVSTDARNVLEKTTTLLLSHDQECSESDRGPLGRLFKWPGLDAHAVGAVFVSPSSTAIALPACGLPLC
eukprot:9476916-Pyramimonas_sp.AAC.1